MWAATTAIENDARTYKPPRDSWACTAPMIRASRPTCGKAASSTGLLVDLKTGEMIHIGGCSRHREWFERTHRTNRKLAAEAKEAGRLPVPAANHGGVLARHFPEIDWRKFWAEINPRWVEHPENEPWVRPTLTVHVGGGQGDEPVTRNFEVIGGQEGSRT